ncbi:MAG: fatty acid desaturase [Actinomycetota bacterium]
MTAVRAGSRDYAVPGPETDAAVEAGLADGQWFQAEIEPSRLAELSARTNGRAAFDTTLWLALIVGAGFLAWNLRSTWWAIPAFAVYGALVGGAADARWHECGHGTAFRTGALNDAVYVFASFLLARRPLFWRWSHFRHHTDTIIRGRDVEIAFTRPPSIPGALLRYTHVPGGPLLMWTNVRTAFGRLSDEDRDIVPADDHRRLIIHARVFTAIWAATVAAAIVTASPWPVLFVGGPTIYGAWLLVFFGITQHAGLQENVLDHRRSTRTVLMNPVFRFLYLNMNYHVEHHMFPAVPYHRLPQLHAEIRDQLAPPNPNVAHAYREIFRAFRHQHDDPDWEIPDRAIPEVRGRRGRIAQEVSWAGGDGRTDLGPADLAPGELKAVRIDGVDYVLARTEGGETVLVDRMCTHGDADLADGLVLGCEIECPRHNGRFDLLTGEPTRKPVRQPLGVRRVHETDGRLQLTMDE